ncbi:uncharacterized protein LOC134845192 [Symsagittifera roscoffensis]|uniref:uncharacterized protein LOC134845192 n=1 Tax=Symsagittifera roscoffensis TaxID=84072 RepID=UPI00307C5CD4
MFVLIFSAFLVCSLTGFQPRVSQDFILPSSHSYKGRICSKFSSLFCLQGFKFKEKVSDRPAFVRDVIDMQTLIRPVYRLLNWFSLFQFGQGGCCDMQTENYLFSGQNYGVSPRDFFFNLTDFSESAENRQLVRMHAQFISNICLNEIQELSFGYGEFQMTGDYKADYDFTMPPMGSNRLMFRFKWSSVRQDITYEKFKTRVICVEQPWICLS